MGKDTINIYLNKQERKMMDDIKYKYQLSLTTIADIITFWTYHTFLVIDQPILAKEHKQEELLEYKLANEYFYEHKYKTSIKKPKRIKSGLFKGAKNQNKAYSKFVDNSLKIYLYKDINKYSNDKNMIQKEYWNKINAELQNTRDEYWNMNNTIRNIRRALKENKDYWQKALDETNGSHRS